MKTIKYLFGLLLVTSLTLFISCGDDEDSGPDPLTIVSIEAIGTDLESGEQVTKDLNGVSAAEAVPVDATITITFSSDVDAATVSATSVSLTPAGDVAVSANGAVVTITATTDLVRGTDYTLSISADVTSAAGGTFTATSRAFKTGGRPVINAPQTANMKFYMNFDGEMVDATGNYSLDVVSAPELVEDRFGFASSAAHFDGNGNIIDVANSADLLSPSITVSTWLKVAQSDSNLVHGYGVLGAATRNGLGIEMGTCGADCSDPTNVNYMWYKFFTNHDNNDGGTATEWGDRLNGNLESEPIVLGQPLAPLVDDVWAHIVLTFDAASGEKNVYVNGILARTITTTLGQIMFPAEKVGLDSNWGIGFYGSSKDKSEGWADYESTSPVAPRTYSGLMDDVRIWDVALSSGDVMALYNAEKP